MDNRQRAAELEEKVEESYRRCDTDGFLSQWANGLTAQKLRAQADIDDAGGVAEFPALFHGDRRVDAKMIDGKFGMVWILSDAEEATFGRKFIPTDQSHNDEREGRSRVQKEYGLVQRYETAPAKAIITGSGTGLSGNAWVTVIRADGR